MISIGTIENISLDTLSKFQIPVYISDWGSNSIHVLDLNNLEVLSTISVGNGPEKMIFQMVMYMYVTLVDGDMKTIVIDGENDIVTNTIEVGDSLTQLYQTLMKIFGFFVEDSLNMMQIGMLFLKHRKSVKITGNSVVSTLNFTGNAQVI